MGLFDSLLKKADAFSEKRNEEIKAEVENMSLPLELLVLNGKHQGEIRYLIDEAGVTEYQFPLFVGEARQIGPVKWQDISDISHCATVGNDTSGFSTTIFVRNGEEYKEGKILKESEKLRRLQMDAGEDIMLQIEDKEIAIKPDVLLRFLKTEWEKRPNQKYDPKNEELDWVDAEKDIFEN